jgi:hypothetical protein
MDTRVKPAYDELEIEAVAGAAALFVCAKGCDPCGDPMLTANLVRDIADPVSSIG